MVRRPHRWVVVCLVYGLLLRRQVVQCIEWNGGVGCVPGRQRPRALGGVVGERSGTAGLGAFQAVSGPVP